MEVLSAAIVRFFGDFDLVPKAHSYRSEVHPFGNGSWVLAVFASPAFPSPRVAAELRASGASLSVSHVDVNFQTPVEVPCVLFRAREHHWVGCRNVQIVRPTFKNTNRNLGLMMVDGFLGL